MYPYHLFRHIITYCVVFSSLLSSLISSEADDCTEDSVVFAVSGIGGFCRSINIHTPDMQRLMTEIIIAKIPIFFFFFNLLFIIVLSDTICNN